MLLGTTNLLSGVRVSVLLIKNRVTTWASKKTGLWVSKKFFWGIFFFLTRVLIVLDWYLSQSHFMKAITRIAVYHLTGNLIRPLYTFWSLVNLLTAAQIHWNEGRSLGFSAQHSVKMEYLKVAKLYFFFVLFTKKKILIIIIIIIIILLLLFLLLLTIINET